MVKGKKKTETQSVTRKFVLVVGNGELGAGNGVSLGCATLTETDATGRVPPEGATEIEAWQNIWGTATYKKVGQALFYTSAKNPSKTWASVAAEGLGEYDTLTLKVTSAGAVTATYKFFKGTFDAKTKKPQYATYTCTTVVLPTKAEPPDATSAEEWFAGYVPVFLPPVAAAGFSGLCVDVAYPFVERAVPVPTQESAQGGNSWFTGEFNGYGDAQFPVGGDTEFLNGLFTVNVASSLAFTGTFTGTDGSTASFSGTFAKDGSSYVANGVSITVKGATMSMTLSCDPGPYAGSDEGFGEMGGGSSAGPDEPCISLNCAWQNIWKRSDLAAEWKPAFATGTEKTIDLSETWLDGLVIGDSLTYAFGAEGVVSITGKIYGEDVNVAAKLHLEGCDSSTDTMHCNVQFIANGHLYQQQFTFPRRDMVEAGGINLSANDFTRLD